MNERVCGSSFRVLLRYTHSTRALPLCTEEVWTAHTTDLNVQAFLALRGALKAGGD